MHNTGEIRILTTWVPNLDYMIVKSLEIKAFEFPLKSQQNKGSQSEVILRALQPTVNIY